jgi:hypothetical protein
MLGENAKTKGDKAAKKTQISIGVQPPYDQIFKGMINNQGGKSKSNSALAFGRRAAGGLVGLAPVPGADALGDLIGG